MLVATRVRGPRVTIEPNSIEDQLFVQLRAATVQRLRAAQRGDGGLCKLLERQRLGCLRELGAHSLQSPRRVLSAA